MIKAAYIFLIIAMAVATAAGFVFLWHKWEHGAHCPLARFQHNYISSGGAGHSLCRCLADYNVFGALTHAPSPKGVVTIDKYKY